MSDASLITLTSTQLHNVTASLRCFCTSSNDCEKDPAQSRETCEISPRSTNRQTFFTSAFSEYFNAFREKLDNKLEYLYRRARVERPLCDIDDSHCDSEHTRPHFATPRCVVHVPTSSPTLIQLLVISYFEANALWSLLYASLASVAAKKGERDCPNRLYWFSPRVHHGQERFFDMRDCAYQVAHMKKPLESTKLGLLTPILFTVGLKNDKNKCIVRSSV